MRLMWIYLLLIRELVSRFSQGKESDGLSITRLFKYLWCHSTIPDNYVPTYLLLKYKQSIWAFVRMVDL